MRVGDEFDRAAGVAVDQRSRHVREVEDPAVAVVAGRSGGGFGEPGRGQLRAGEHHGRQPGVVDPGRPGTTGGEGVDRRDPAGRGGDVDVLRGGGDIPGCVYARVRGALRLVDVDEAALVGPHPGGGEVQALGAGPAAGGHQ